MISNEKIDEIFCGCNVKYKFISTAWFRPGIANKISMSRAIQQHLGSSSFTILAIELTEENKKRLYEYLASL